MNPVLETYGQDLEYAAIEKLVNTGFFNLAIDVGAATGATTVLLSKAGKCISLEPLPQNFEKLRVRFKNNSKVQTHMVAATSHDGDVEFNLAADKNEEESEYYHSLEKYSDNSLFRSGRTLKVKAMKLDTLLRNDLVAAETSCLLKIDTEGHDLEVLKGATDSLGGKIPCILVEFWSEPHPLGAPRSPHSAMVEFLAARGYSNYLTFARNDELEFISLNRPEPRPGDWGNILFFHDKFFQLQAGFIYRLLGDLEHLCRLKNEKIFHTYKHASIERLKAINELNSFAMNIRDQQKNESRWNFGRFAFIKHRN